MIIEKRIRFTKEEKLFQKQFLSKSRLALEGLLYYLGYDDIYYPRNNGITEGAIAQEFNKLIYSKCKTHGYNIISEYKDGGNGFFDTVISKARNFQKQKKKRRDNANPRDVKVIIEIKRGNAGIEEIKKDVSNLNECHDKYTHAKTYLLLTFQDFLNKKFIKKTQSEKTNLRESKNENIVLYNPKGDTAFKGIQEMNGIKYRVKICKHIFTSVKNAIKFVKIPGNNSKSKKIKSRKYIGKFAFLLEVL